MPSMTEPADRIVLPLHQETLTVDRHRVETGVVRVSTVTREHEAIVDETLAGQQVEIQRVPIGRPIEAIPPIREEGDTTIIPVVEEIIVVEKRLILKEEVHLRRVHVTKQHRETVILRQQEPVIARANTETGAVTSDKPDI